MPTTTGLRSSRAVRKACASCAGKSFGLWMATYFAPVATTKGAWSSS